jgi:hypothetical protein
MGRDETILNEIKTWKKAKCLYNSGIYTLTEGKIYDIVAIVPYIHLDNYTFPNYIVVIDDNGGNTQCHYYRFEGIK